MTKTKNIEAKLGGRRTKPLKAGEEGQLSVAMDATVLIALDRMAARCSLKQGCTIRRSDVVNFALREWLLAHAK